MNVWESSWTKEKWGLELREALWIHLRDDALFLLARVWLSQLGCHSIKLLALNTWLRSQLATVLTIMTRNLQRYSASTELRETVVCFLGFQEMSESHKSQWLNVVNPHTLPNPHRRNAIVLKKWNDRTDHDLDGSWWSVEYNALIIDVQYEVLTQIGSTCAHWKWYLVAKWWGRTSVQLVCDK